jgi:hypothetical protein
MFLFDYVCMNRIIWGAQQFTEIGIKHTAGAPHRWLEEVKPILRQYAEASAAPVAETIAAARETKIKGDIETFLANRFGSKSLAQSIQASHMLDEAKPIETIWDAVTGATAYARQLVYVDARVDVERKAGDSATPRRIDDCSTVGQGSNALPYHGATGREPPMTLTRRRVIRRTWNRIHCLCDPGICPGRIRLRMVPCRRHTLGRSPMPNYIDNSTPREARLRATIQVSVATIHRHKATGKGNGYRLFVATSTSHEGISIGIDLCRAALKSGDPDYDKPSN